MQEKDENNCTLFSTIQKDTKCCGFIIIMKLLVIEH